METLEDIKDQRHVAYAPIGFAHSGRDFELLKLLSNAFLINDGPRLFSPGSSRSTISAFDRE